MRLSNFQWYRKLIACFTDCSWYKYESTGQLPITPATWWTRKQTLENRFVQLVDEEHWMWMY